MRKIFILCLSVLALSISAHVTDSKFFDGTYVTVKGGATALMHPGCNGYENLGHTFEAATGLELGKWITPNWGFSLDGTNGWTNGSKMGMFQDDYAVNYVTVAALGKYRFMPFGKFNIALAAGPQWIHGFKKGAPDANDMGAKMKIEFNWNFAQHFALQVAPELNYNMRHTEPGAVLQDGVTPWIPTKTGNQPYFDSRRAWYGLMVGVTYKIGQDFQECTYKYSQADIDALNAEINELRARQPEVIEKVVEKVVVKDVQTGEWIVFFDYGSETLDATAKEILNKIPAGTKVSVVGETSTPGSPEYNQKLSYRRAIMVENYLRGRGVQVGDVKGVGETGHQIVRVKVQ